MRGFSALLSIYTHEYLLCVDYVPARVRARTVTRTSMLVRKARTTLPVILTMSEPLIGERKWSSFMLAVTQCLPQCLLAATHAHATYDSKPAFTVAKHFRVHVYPI